MLHRLSWGVAAAALVIALVALQRAEPRPANSRASEPSAAATLLAALDAYERGIDMIWWTQDAFFPPSGNRNRVAWHLLERSERRIGTDWHWVHSSEHASANPPDWKLNYRSTLFFGDGTHRVSIGFEPLGGMLTQPDSFFAGGCNVWRLLGRFTDYAEPMRSRSLTEELGTAQDLEYLPPTTEAPWPGLRAVGALSRGGLDVEIRLDPDHAFAPRTIFLYRRMDGLLVEGLVVLEYQLAGEVWLPRVGIQGVRYLDKVADVGAPVPPERTRDFQRAAALEGLPLTLQTDEMRQWIARFQSIEVRVHEESLFAGPMSCFNPSAPMDTPQIMLVTSVRINEPDDPASYFDRLPADATMFNGFTGERTDAIGIQRFLQMLQGLERDGNGREDQ